MDANGQQRLPCTQVVCALAKAGALEELFILWVESAGGGVGR
jgi:hypothetical protein